MKRVILLALVTACLAEAPATETVIDDPGLKLAHERDAYGTLVTVLDAHDTELCMFQTEPGETFDYAHIANVCGWARR